jgi:hypothetical protein
VSEVRITSATGGQKGQKDCRLGAVDPLALYELGLVAGMGEEKYDRFNYLKGYAWSLNVDAAFRHLLAFLSGEDRDPESGHLHTAHAMWHMGALTSFQLRKIGTDDRAPVLEPEPYNPYADPLKRDVWWALEKARAQLGLAAMPEDDLCPARYRYGPLRCSKLVGHLGSHMDETGSYFVTRDGPTDVSDNPWGDA